MDKHTPGPWEVATGPGTSGGIKHAAGYIAFTGLPRKVSDEKAPGESWLDMRERTQAERTAVEQEEKANARLIAAAPALDDLVKEARAAMTAYLEDHQHNAPHDCYATGPKTGDEFHDLVRCPGCCAEKAFTSLVAKIDAALAKARGEK